MAFSSLLRELELEQHLLGNLRGRTLAGLDEHVRLAVKGIAHGEKFANLAQWVSGLQQGPMGLCLHPFPNDFGRGPQANDQGMGFKTGQIGRVDNETAASGNDRFLPLAQIPDHVVFQLAKDGLALLFEDFLDGHSALGFDEFVGIDKLELQRLGSEAADGRFAGAHKTDQGDILYAAHKPKAKGFRRRSARRSYGGLAGAQISF
jgi:hypothetical protein